jgi:hypothetical protein
MLMNQEITEAVIGAAIEVHKTLGHGLLDPLTNCACAMNCNFGRSNSNGKSRFRFPTRV